MVEFLEMSVLKGRLLHAEPVHVAAAINTQTRFRFLALEHAKFRSPLPYLYTTVYET